MKSSVFPINFLDMTMRNNNSPFTKMVGNQRSHYSVKKNFLKKVGKQRKAMKSALPRKYQICSDKRLINMGCLHPISCENYIRISNLGGRNRNILEVHKMSNCLDFFGDEIKN
jgi:hypothetical protein